MAVDRSRLMEGPVSRFQVGDCLSLGFSVWARNLVPFATLTALVHLPLVLYTVVLLGKGQPGGEPGAAGIAAAWDTWGYVTWIGSVLLSMIATGAMTYGVVQQLRGQPAGFGACVSVGLARLLPVLGVGLLVGICVALGFVLLIVPGVILMCMLWVAVPIAVIERPGVVASLRRSADLTKGSRMPIFGVLILLGLIGWVVNFIVQMALFSPPSWDRIGTYLIVHFLVGVVLMGSLQSTVNAVGYWLLRSNREGASIEDLAKVFS